MDGRVSNQALVPIILTLPTPLVLGMALRACRRRFSRRRRHRILPPCEAIEIQLLTFDRLAAFIRALELLLLQQNWARVESQLA